MCIKQLCYFLFYVPKLLSKNILQIEKKAFFDLINLLFNFAKNTKLLYCEKD